MDHEYDDYDDDFIAVIGMAGRFPGAPDVRAYWDNLLQGVDSVSAAPRSWSTPKGVLADHDLFDAEFFGFSPKEAERTDPQQRLFLECAWEALEHAGYGDGADRPVTGIYAGSSTSRYMLDVLSSPHHRDLLDDSQLLIGCDKDYLTTRTAHKLDLRGPSVVVQTACSTSLVAVHMAVQALLAGECDMALAGGVAVRGAEGLGRGSIRPDGMLSPEGRCRAFDANATGMVNGDGLGLVVLRRLEDALRDGDTVYAVVRGSAINNDGALKAGFTAPAIEGQARVIRAAHAAAAVDPATIGYVEAHGTGTRLGDPIEVAALAEAVAGVEPGDRCALGSVKTNIGHLDAAAGVASLIKVVLSLRNRVIPPTLHFERPNPELRLDSTPFFVNTEARPWEPISGVRRAGVSSFGIGGTNAHVVLEEAPAVPPSDRGRPWQLIPVSARTAAARDRALAAVGDAVRDMDGPGFADAAYTMQVGRHGFGHRGVVVARSGAEAAAGIAAGDRRRVVVGESPAASAPLPVAFMFSGQGTQYVGMARGLYEAEPVFHDELDACLDLVAAAGVDLRGVLWPAGADLDAELALQRTSMTQPALFAIEYALARLWMSWGIEPAVLIGHSIGELVAACVAGVMSREDGVRLVLARGHAMAESPNGAMTAVTLAEEQVLAGLPDGVEIAAVNATSQTVVAGDAAAIAALEADYLARGIGYRRLRTSHAFHTAAMDRAAEAVAKAAAGLTLSPPRLVVVSNVTGRPLTAAEATDPGYWGRQVRATVRFADGLDAAAAAGARLLVEMGPGRALCDLSSVRDPAVAFAAAVPSLPGPARTREDLEVMLGSAGRLWLHGAAVDWTALHGSQRRRRIAMPAYPFERRRYTVEGGADPWPDGEAETAPALDVAGFSETEQVVAGVWTRLLGVGGIGRDESFFDIGGHSLLGMQALDELSRLFQVELPLAAFYEHPTIAELAVLIEDTILSTLDVKA
ncbi:acyltransferase domain-containing protein [Planomonospora sp. ID67723]|uniref:type I polyketide synthase n=1 Tax=Planomonospora sp. ID67723 TaxID=2738134 RepID=UPI0018C3794B|nr:type I polyketide synthase [Planomonospora sp. ID67723]MBG0833231.1 acyltransferase domain-containing protein [Planomonospora sp. ID67723]